jgi:hypothetical protein
MRSALRDLHRKKRGPRVGSTPAAIASGCVAGTPPPGGCAGGGGAEVRGRDSDASTASGTGHAPAQACPNGGNLAYLYMP